MFVFACALLNGVQADRCSSILLLVCFWRLLSFYVLLILIVLGMFILFRLFYCIQECRRIAAPISY